MLKAKFKNVGEWKAIVNAIGDVVEDAMFICNEDGVTFRGMDVAHIALLDVTFPHTSFEYLESQTSFFGLKVDDFKKVLNSCGNEDIIELEITNSDSMKISVTGTLKMEFNLRLIEKTKTNTPIPKADYKVKASLDPAVFSRVLSNLQNISEYVTIDVHNDRIQFSGNGDVGDAKIDIKKDSPELKSLETLEVSNAIYSLEYMAKIIRNIGKASKNLSFEFASQTPIHMSFEMPSMIKVEYYLAPRTLS